MKWATLEDVSTLVSKGTTPTTLGHSFVPEGIPFLRAEDVAGTSIDPKSVAFCISEQTDKLLSRSRLQPGDLLITIAGTLGRIGYVPKNAPPMNCNQAVAFVRLKPQLIDLHYACFACQAQIADLLALQKIGTIGNLNLEQVRQFKIPLPSLYEQKRVATLLSCTERLHHTRQYTLELTNIFLPAVFIELFGDPITNSMGWEVCALGELGELDRGRSKHRPRNAPELLGGPYPLIQTGDVANSNGYIRTYKQTYSELGLKQSKMWPKGTLCITIAANIAKTGILLFDACFPDSVVGFTPNRKANTEYVQLWFSFIQQYLERTAPESAQKNINLEILRGLRIPVPPLSLQQKIATVVQKVEQMRAVHHEVLRQAEHLFQSLLHDAFGTATTHVESKAHHV